MFAQFLCRFRKKCYLCALYGKTRRDGSYEQTECSRIRVGWWY